MYKTLFYLEFPIVASYLNTCHVVDKKGVESRPPTRKSKHIACFAVEIYHATRSKCNRCVPKHTLLRLVEASSYETQFNKLRLQARSQ